jgi:hypothetical protein
MPRYAGYLGHEIRSPIPRTSGSPVPRSRDDGPQGSSDAGSVQHHLEHDSQECGDRKSGQEGEIVESRTTPRRLHDFSPVHPTGQYSKRIPAGRWACAPSEGPSRQAPPLRLSEAWRPVTDCHSPIAERSRRAWPNVRRVLAAVAGLWTRGEIVESSPISPHRSLTVKPAGTRRPARRLSSAFVQVETIFGLAGVAPRGLASRRRYPH